MNASVEGKEWISLHENQVESQKEKEKEEEFWKR